MYQVRSFAFSLVAVGAAYAAYLWGVVPYLEPAPRVRAAEGPGPEVAAATDSRGLAELFPAEAWERQNPKVVETEQGILLLKDYLPTADGRVELKPCTLVVFPSRTPAANGSRRAIVLQAPEGAILQFDRPMDLRRAEVGKLVGGRLAGEVRIWSRESEPGAGDDLEVVTRNVQMSPDKIWTPHDVRFRFGRSQGSGRDLLLHLNTQGDTAEGLAPKNRGPKLLELVHVERVRLDVGANEMPANPFAGLTNSRAAKPGSPLLGATAPTPPPASAPVEITCRGPFMYHFESQVASFEDHVDVRRLLPDGPSDELSCQLIEAHFGRAPPAPPPAAAAPAAAGNSPSGAPQIAAAPPAAKKGLAPGLQRLVARGHPVYFRSPAMAIALKAERLEYDLVNRRLLLDDERQVQLQRQRQHIEAPQVAYQLPLAGELGTIWAAGPGRFRGPLRDDDAGDVDLAWGKTLQLRPYEGRHVLSLVEGALIGMPGLGRLAAEQVHLWIRQMPAAASVAVPAPSSSAERPAPPPSAAELNAGRQTSAGGPHSDANTPSSSEGAAKGAPGASAARFVPERLLALGKVVLDSPQFTGRTERLEMYVIPPREGTPPAGSDAAGNAAGRLSPAGLSRPAPSQAAPPGEAPAQAAPSERLALSGKLVRVQLQTVGAEFVLAEASIDGQVQLSQALPGGHEALAFSLAGDALYLRQPSPQAAYVRVVGKPARIMAREIEITGSNVQLDRQQNHIWIEGGGELRMPLGGNLLAGGSLAPPSSQPQPSPVPSAGAGSAPHAGNPAASAAKALVTWDQRLDFNGSALRFLGNVVVRTDQQTANAAALDALLSEPVDLASGKSPGKVGLRQVVLRGQVRIENRALDERQQLLAIDRLTAGELTVDQISGEVIASGPGTLNSVRRTASLALPGAAAPRANPVPPSPGFGAVNNPPPADERLSFIKLDFQRHIEGNIQRREVKVSERVKVIYGPVREWTDTLAGTTPAELGPEGVLLQCDQLSLREMSLFGGTRKPVELLAEGNTVVEGTAFTARAHRLAYAQMKDQLVLEGDSRGDAELWRTSSGGGPATHAAARKILYWRKDNRVEVEDARFLDLGSLPGATEPRR